MKKETPILFSTEMVKAILDGRKTQTRRIMKIQPDENGVSCMPNAPLDWESIYKEEWKPWKYETEDGERIAVHCPYGEIGDILWVREKWENETSNGKSVNFYAGNAEVDHNLKYRRLTKWKPSIHLKRVDARLFLKITNIHIERLQNISKTDAIAEGIKSQYVPLFSEERYFDYITNTPADFREPWSSFFSLWESINGKESLYRNPWVWVIEFKKVTR